MVLDRSTLPGSIGTTFGNTIYIGPAEYAKLRDPASFNEFKSLLVHEYVHVLDDRAQGAGYLPDYVGAAAGAVQAGQQPGSPANALEAPQYQIQGIYRANPWLPAPWAFPR